MKKIIYPFIVMTYLPISIYAACPKVPCDGAIKTGKKTFDASLSITVEAINQLIKRQDSLSVIEKNNQETLLNKYDEYYQLQLKKAFKLKETLFYLKQTRKLLELNNSQ